MKVVVLNGSPNPDGTVVQLLKSVISGLDSRVKVEWIDVYDLNMQFCMGCMKCRADGKCALPADDAHTVGQKIRDAEGIVIGTPNHWGNMSVDLKLLLDRNVPVFIGEKAKGFPEPRQKGKPAIIVSACATPWPFNIITRESRGSISSVKHVLFHGGYRILGTIVQPGIKKKRAISADIYQRANKLGRKLSHAITKYIIGRRVDYKNTIESYNLE